MSNALVRLAAWARLGAVSAMLIVAGPAVARSPLGLARPSAILVDAESSRILYSDAAEQIRHPASITKVMTLFLAFDALKDGRLRLTDRIVMSRRAAAQAPSKLGLAAGQEIAVEDAIRVIAVKSANDIAVALAEHLAGSEARFAEAMTRKARALGMRQTMFSNATGLPDPATFTSARDLALLSVAILREHPDRYGYFSRRTLEYQRQRMNNHNRLLGVVPGVDGIKTGYTVDAGFTLAASAVRGGRRLIAVVLGEPSTAARNLFVTQLLDAGFTALALQAQGRDADVARLLPPQRAMRVLPRMIVERVDPEDAPASGSD